MNHLSEEEIFLYCDNEIPPDKIEKVSKHLNDCEQCNEKYKEFKNFNSKLFLISKEQFNHLSDMQISEYIDNTVLLNERSSIEEHLNKCDYCSDILKSAKDFLEKYCTEEKKEDKYLNVEKISDIIKKKFRETQLDKFTKILDIVFNKNSSQIKQELESKLKNIFMYPTPCFAPVFGETKFNILGPFGKIRYPIIFEWIEFKEADFYIISIHNIDWMIKTQKTKIEVGCNELKLDYGKEYMWELKVMKQEKVIDKITGFFNIAVENELKNIIEIENNLNNIKSSQDRIFLSGVILEENGFYIEAIKQYKIVYNLEPLSYLAYRIAYCYNKLELEEFKNEWNKKIKD